MTPAAPQSAAHDEVRRALAARRHLMPGDEAHAVGLLDAYYARHAVGASGPTVAHPAKTAS